ncbi:Cellulose synthase-like protein e1 [Thalictrum thalictroides]|uniref:Cellulose synthase-like protein e1 n=1 Tax=Thalictrum thalictroides TaxID=46969 RepID=A0A7J6V2J7_THATH|nr:Cellulose synthase-like protein e1 [Thalictrum thalictroides]
MWMMKGTSSYLFAVMVIIFKTLGISEPGFEITSKVIDEEALKRYKREIMEFAVASPMFIPPTTLALLHLFCLLKTLTMALKVGLEGLDHMVVQVIVSGYITAISLPLYEAMFLRKDKGRMPIYVTIYAIGILSVLLYLSPSLM